LNACSDRSPSSTVPRVSLSFSPKDMLQPDVYWVRELQGVRLALMPRPRGGDYLADEIDGWSRLGVETVVSLLEQHEIRELDLAAEESLCLAANLQFISFGVPDRGVPSNSANVSKLLTPLEAQLRSGHSVAVHCRAGIGRSGLIGACLLNAFGVDPDSAFGMLSRARGIKVPDTDAQVAWVRAYTRERSWPG
jgi:protein-tyrosine phosphatase